MFIRGYLRASTKEQDATRAKQLLIDTAGKYGQKIASFYIENESGRKLRRPELMRLLEESGQGDILLVESTDRLTRLTSEEWESLKQLIRDKGLQIVVCDLPTSHGALSTSKTDEMTQGILKAVNQMLLDILATMACKDYELRKERSKQGIAKAKANGLYKGRPEDQKRNVSIMKMLDSGMSYTEIQRATGAARATISKLKKRLVA